jgi:hypothetical protein
VGLGWVGGFRVGGLGCTACLPFRYGRCGWVRCRCRVVGVSIEGRVSVTESLPKPTGAVGGVWHGALRHQAQWAQGADNNLEVVDERAC